MQKTFYIVLFSQWLLCTSALANTYTDEQAIAAWGQSKHQKVTEETFRKTCDLLQDIAQTNINISYKIFAEYLPIVKATGNWHWTHILLMNWARAKESLQSYEAADSLYNLARENASNHVLEENEAFVATVLLYLEWGKEDSLHKYLNTGEYQCRQSGDRENLSFIYSFKALSDMGDTAAMRKNFDSAISLAQGIQDKNALFTAMYNRAVFYSQFNLLEQATAFATLLELSKDSSLARKPKLYERTAFSFRSPVPSIYYQLMLVNLLLTDYDEAGKFAALFYDAMVKPNPTGAQASNFNAVMALVKAYQGDYKNAKIFLQKSFTLFHTSENNIAYPTYHIAAGMISEQENKMGRALNYYAAAYKSGSMSYGLHLMPPAIYFAHALILNHQLDSAQKLFEQLSPILKTRTYSAIGFYYYKYDATLLKAKGDYAGYDKAMELFYNIKDSLSNIIRYRAIQELEARIRLHDKEQQIVLLDKENQAEQSKLKTEEINLAIITSLATIIILLLIAYSRNQNKRKTQAEEIARQNEILQQHKIVEMEKQHRIEVMQGAIEAEERERYKIADQLHDETGSMLALATLNISSAIERGHSDGQMEEKLRKAHEILNSVSSSIRDISHRLTPLVIEKYGFRKVIEDLDHTINLSGKLKLETVIIGFEEETTHFTSLRNDLYRIIQELIHNILKHAHATHARLEIVEHENQITVMIEDDGIGIEEQSLNKGKGLNGIQSKVSYLNGKMEIMKKKDRGTLIVIELTT